MQTLVETNKEQELIPKSFLQSGKDLKITESIYFKHPLVQDIFNIDEEHMGLYSEDIYYSMVNVFLTDPYTYMVYLYDKGIDYEQTKPFEVFCLLFKDYINRFENLSQLYTKDQLRDVFSNNIYYKAFRFFLGIENIYIAKDKNNNDVLAYGNGQFLLDSYTYDYIMEFVKKINGIPDIEKIYPEDEWAKQILIDDEREKLEKQEKNKMKNADDKPNKNRLGNLLSSITWSCNGGITPFNRNQLHIYDLVEGISRTDKLLQYNNTMTGLYFGCIDKKKVNFKELHWSV